MFIKSIRGRLSLTYAAIALLVALSLGAVLLVTVRLYYQGQEYDYLQHNAQVLVAPLSRYLGGLPGLPEEASTLQSLSFLTRTRIRLLDARGQTLADSGSPTPTQINLAYKENMTPQGPVTNLSGSLILLTKPNDISQNGNLTSGAISVQPQPDPSNVRAQIFTFSIPVNASLYGVSLNSNLGAQDYTPSSQVVRQPVIDTSGATLGYVELSEGPAYGREIENSVVRGWAISGGVAVLLALLAGWWFSRRISAPVLALTASTRRMAAGDLSARAQVKSRDELGALAVSFNTMAASVEETVAALRRFVADAAHELQTPLTALRTNLELARGEGGPAGGSAYLDSAEGQVQRLNHLVRDLLDLSRLEAGVDGGSRAPLDLAACVRQASEPYASQAEQAGVTLDLRLPAGEVVVAGDEKKLRRLLGNLLDNALKFTPAGGRVTVALEEDGGWACLRVDDTGIGIPPEDLEGMFARFHRGRNAAAYPGSGLGLAIVKAIAGELGGRVCAENTTEGARFSLFLPAAGGAP